MNGEDLLPREAASPSPARIRLPAFSRPGPWAAAGSKAGKQQTLPALSDSKAESRRPSWVGAINGIRHPGSAQSEPRTRRYRRSAP